MLQRQITTTLSKLLLFILLLFHFSASADWLLIPMSEDEQRDHLKAYGIAFWTLERGVEVEWLLNYHGGSFMIPSHGEIARECTIRGVSFQTISDSRADAILAQIASPSVNMEAVKLEKAPKIAVYSPPGNQPWDDAVTLVLTYAEIPYDIIYDQEVLADELTKYDWLHLHHEDFTGQYGKFYGSFRTAAWYIEQKRQAELDAAELGYNKVSELKRDVALRIKEYVAGGGFLFAMCSATDSYDIALSAAGVDICEPMFDGDPSDPAYGSHLDFSATLAFRDFTLSTNPMEYEFSNIDMTGQRRIDAENDFFTLFEYSAKWDVIPSMLCQNHTRIVPGFMGQTTAYRRDLLKPDVLVMGENRADNEARYIHGELGRGQWTFYGGHDPEDYTHRVGDPPTELELHPNSPGYRLILNNILFPAARKQKQKT